MNNKKLKYAIIVSFALHLIAIGLLVGVVNEQRESMESEKGYVLDAIIVDPNIVERQGKRQEIQQEQAAQAERRRRQQREQQEISLQEDLARRQEELKALEKARLQAQALEKQQQEATKAAEALKRQQEEAARLVIEQKKQEEEAAKLALAEKKKVEEEAKKLKEVLDRQKKEAEQQQKEVEAARKRAEAEKKKAEDEAAKAKAEAEKQKRLAEEAKKKAQTDKKQQQEVDDLFAQLAGGNEVKSIGKKEINSYLLQVKNAIQRQFNAELFKGRTCLIQVKLANDGLLLDVVIKKGDEALCREAVRATRMANIPKVPNQQIYKQAKNAEIEFSP